MSIRLRRATLADLPAIEALIARSARGLSRDDYRPAQIESALRGAFGVDTQLLVDGTYFLALEVADAADAVETVVGCGGWSFRATLFGGDARAGRDSSTLDPTTQPAKIRAFFVEPSAARRGIASLLLARCESEARAHGFSRTELMATLPGVKFYSRRGYIGNEDVRYDTGFGEFIEFKPMHKQLRSTAMTDLSDYPITRKWPPQHPDRLQLYSLPTPNGIKVSILLEELGLPYEPHLVRFDTNEQLSEEFLTLNPNNKIPAIIDPDGPGGAPLALFESGAILLYLAEKSGRFIPQDPAGRYETVQWLMFQMGGVGPMFGQLGFFHKFGGKDYEDKRPRDRYLAETRRLLGVLNLRLAGRRWILGADYTIADIAIFPWVRTLIGFYEAGALVHIEEYPHVTRALAAFLERPAVVAGADIPRRAG